MEWIFIAIIIGLIALAIFYWQITIVVAIVGGIAFFIYKQNRDEEERLKRIEDERERNARTQLEAQRRLGELAESALNKFEAAPKFLLKAESYLNRAEVDFLERAYAPFWDRVEDAINALGNYDTSVRNIEELAKESASISWQLEGDRPSFPINSPAISRLVVGADTSRRMQAIVRRAQRDFQFATIFEQRKTNQILVAGFRNLAHALSDMTTQLTSSIDGLNLSVNKLSQDFTSVGQGIQQEVKAFSSESAARQLKVIEMLDNIQRRRQPTGSVQ
jgi:hypothetical protein